MRPLHVLLSHALLDLTRASERAGVEEVVLWSNLLRATDREGVAVRDLPARVRLSKRVVKTGVNGLLRRGWAVTRGEILHLSTHALDVRERWRHAVVGADANWPGSAILRAPLETFVACQPLEHPHYPCGYGTADWRITGGPGVDWKPVPRVPGTDTVSDLPTLALLSQALVAFTVEYESRVPFALMVGMYLDQLFRDGSIPLADAPRALRISGNGRSSLERHGAVSVAKGTVTLTGLGALVRDAYRPALDAIENEWNIGDLCAALETIDVHGAGHADHPDVAYLGPDLGFAEISARN